MIRPHATVILFFNKPALTLRCISSVKKAAEKISEPHGLLLVDNGSTTKIDVGAHEEVLRLNPNQGFARGMNAGLRAAFADPQCRFVTTLSNDVELDESYFQCAAEFASQHRSQGAILVAPHVYFLSDRLKASYTHGFLDTTNWQLTHHFDPRLSEIRFPNYYPAAALLWSREAFEKLQGFDERYFCYWEDVELSHRCHQKGVKILSTPSLRIHHLGRGTTGGKRIYTTHFETGKKLTQTILSGLTFSSDTK
jgi:GT2 family glycosyltransferase